MASLASADLFISDLVSEGYTSGTLFSSADNAICTSGKGVDISTALTLSDAQCLYTNAVHTVIARAWHSSGTVDTAVCGSLKNAQSAGIAHRDVYMFPCPTCSASAASQISSMVSYLNANCGTAWTKWIWLDIEGSQYWTGSYASNKTWYQNLLNACMATTGVTCGIYSSAVQWQAIFGSTSYCYGQAQHMWYAHYDSVCSMSDYTTYGCWTTPFAKQYEGTHTACNIGVDSDYIPSWP